MTNKAANKKIFILDTNVLLTAGKTALKGFDEHLVVIPLIVVEELEKKRKDGSSVSPIARSVLRELDYYNSKETTVGKRLSDGVIVNKQGGILRVEMNHIKEHEDLKYLTVSDDNDARILNVVKNFQDEEKAKADQGEEYSEIIFVTLDLPLRLKAEIQFGIKVQPFIAKGEIYDGIETLTVSDDLFDNKNFEIGKLKAPAEINDRINGLSHKAFVLISDLNPNRKEIGLYKNGLLHKGIRKPSLYKDFRAKNVEQEIAVDYLGDKDIEILSLGGKAGTGKTSLTVASAMKQVETGRYEKIVVIRPLYSVGGQELGYTPGDTKDKMNPWTQPIYDSVEKFIPTDIIKKLQDKEVLEVISSTYMRGRTLHNSFVIIDEAQNFEFMALMTMLSRVGDGSKIAFLWDAMQKDNVKLSYNDGIVSVLEYLKEEASFAHISLVKSERSKTAGIAGRILEEYMG